MTTRKIVEIKGDGKQGRGKENNLLAKKEKRKESDEARESRFRHILMLLRIYRKGFAWGSTSSSFGKTWDLPEEGRVAGSWMPWAHEGADDVDTGTGAEYVASAAGLAGLAVTLLAQEGVLSSTASDTP